MIIIRVLNLILSNLQITLEYKNLYQVIIYDLYLLSIIVNYFIIHQLLLVYLLINIWLLPIQFKVIREIFNKNKYEIIKFIDKISNILNKYFKIYQNTYLKIYIKNLIVQLKYSLFFNRLFTFLLILTNTHNFYSRINSMSFNL